MFRKTLIAIATAGTLALGMSAVSTPANANVTITIGNGFHGGYGWHNRWHNRSCFVRLVKVRHHHKWVWRKVRVCDRHRGW